VKEKANDKNQTVFLALRALAIAFALKIVLYRKRKK
jgi:hypothetical protein